MNIPLIGSLAILLASSVSAAFAEPTRIVFDTDMCGDYDDVGALAVLNALADDGECEILAIVSSSRSSPALGMCETVNESYGRATIPMGVCKGIGYVSPEEKGVNEVFRSMVAARREWLHYPNSNDAPDANKVYRRVLADSPDGSVTLCTVGFLTNIRRLLETKGDDISPLTGRELVAKKVKAWYAMGGALPQGRECNLMLDPESSAIAIRDCPVPICFVDFNLGRDVLTGIPVARQGTAAGPVAEAFVRCMKVWNEERRGRPSWDELTVLAAVRGWERDFTLERGTMSVDPSTGSNTWTKAENGPHGVLVEKTPKANLRDIIDELIARPPVCRKDNTKPFVWWHWCGTAVTKEGIVRDLDAMRDAGIGGATIFQVARGPCSEVPAFGYDDDTMKDFDFASDKWWEYVEFAAREAKKRELKIGMHNCPGYTVSGGPWITPELAMKKLVWTSAPKGSKPAQPETNLGFYREIGTVEKGGKVYRFGYTCTGSQCMPVAMSMYGKCLEADKMSDKAVNLHLDHVLARNVGLDFILMDSYEAGPYDWTDDFRAEFEKRRGYDPLPLLPAYVGAVQEGAEKIKVDMARTVGELSTERHYWVFRDRIHEKGMKFVVEPYGGPFDHCEAAYASDLPTTEFWGARPFWVAPGVIGGSPQLGGAVGRAAGKTILAAEAYTAMPFQDPYVLAPRDFKACTDASFARGINCMFLHHWVHQPFPACRKPGMNMGYWGAHFGENATWFEPGKEFIAYLSRCQEMLQRGEEVVDVLAVEDFRGITDGVDIVPRRIFLGGVEFASGSVLVRNHGNSRSYRYLAVPGKLLSDPAIAAKVEEARKSGVKILGEDAELPKRPFSVVDGVKGGANGPILGSARYDTSPFFFVANVSSEQVSFTADFRAEGQAELWYPGTGETEFLKPVDPVDGYVRLPMRLEPQESVFVTFHTGAAWPESRRREPTRIRQLEGGWSVSFEKGRGAPDTELALEKLSSWSESTIPGVRYFSGTATYRTRFTLTKDEAKATRKISLGDVRDIARVRLNGRDLGVAWYEPFEVLTCDAAKEGDNELEVEVTNGWHNRLLGDHLLPGDDCVWGPERSHQCHLDGSKGACGRGLKRIPDWAWNADGSRPATNRVTFTSWDYFCGTEKPSPSGLLGQVSVVFQCGAADLDATASWSRSSAESLFATWCDALLARQISGTGDKMIDGGIACPACGVMHGRVCDLVYPLVYRWATTGNGKYLAAAEKAVEWSEATMLREDGGVYNDYQTLWWGTTVFAQIALGKTLLYYGDRLPRDLHSRWSAIFKRETDFVVERFDDKFVNITNVNYPAAFCEAMALAGVVLKDDDKTARARAMAEKLMAQFLPDGLLTGEGAPMSKRSPRGHAYVDLGYNLEETLPTLFAYAEICGDAKMKDAVLASAIAHAEFILPDGGMDNSFGSRSPKWTYYGSRTSDGMLPILGALAKAGVPWAAKAMELHLDLYRRCTNSAGLLAGGVQYEAADEPACVHHSFAHIKSIVDILRNGSIPEKVADARLPRENCYGLKSFPSIGVELAAIGPWRATFAGGDSFVQGMVGHRVSGGGPSLLWHEAVGPLIVGTMADYSIIEARNLQDLRHERTVLSMMPRIEAGDMSSSARDVDVEMKATCVSNVVVCSARGQLTGKRGNRGAAYELVSRVDEKEFSLGGKCDVDARFILPVVALNTDRVEIGNGRVLIKKDSSIVTIESELPFELARTDRGNRAFSPIGGFLYAYLTAPIHAENAFSVQISVESK